MSGVVLPRKNRATHINVERAPQPRSCRVSGPGICDLYSRDAESYYSRKPLFGFAHHYALGPGLSALSPRSRILGAGTLIHPRIKIRSWFPRRGLLGDRVVR